MVPACEWPGDAATALTRSSPRVLVVSGHYHGHTWVAEGQGRAARLVAGGELGRLLAESNPGALPEMVVLNGCASTAFAEGLAAALREVPGRRHDVHLVHCTTKLHDDFAVAFSRELCGRIPETLGERQGFWLASGGAAGARESDGRYGSQGG